MEWQKKMRRWQLLVSIRAFSNVTLNEFPSPPPPDDHPCCKDTSHLHTELREEGGTRKGRKKHGSLNAGRLRKVMKASWEGSLEASLVTRTIHRGAERERVYTSGKKEHLHLIPHKWKITFFFSRLQKHEAADRWGICIRIPSRSIRGLMAICAGAVKCLLPAGD